MHPPPSAVSESLAVRADLQELSGIYDVLVAGGGNAALCAALAAREAGARVLLVEHAPRAFRGGNSRHTRNLRAMHQEPTSVLTGAYPEAEYWEDLRRVTAGRTDERLARMTIRASADATAWMEARGVRFQPSLKGTLNLSRTNAFFLGGGKALLNAYYRAADRMGVDVLYDSEVQALTLDGSRVREVTLTRNGFPVTVRAKALVAASGGFQGNLEWLKEYWGEAADNFLIRGTPYAKGRILRNLLDQGVASVGDPTQCHAVAIDARAPRFDGGIVTRLDCIPFGIVVDREGKRFYDEGEDVWPKRYAIWGRLVAQRPGQSAACIVDAKAAQLFMPSVFPAYRANTIGELASQLGLDPGRVEETVRGFNAAVRPGSFDPDTLDSCQTEGLDPPKTHWARTLDTPPFFGYPLRPGITFTYLGVKVNERAQVLREGGQPVSNLFAAGEIMAGNILGQGYLAGFGMTIGTVFGRIAGTEAARHALG
jgi:tricarballylate dehydrogenase